MDIKNEVDRLNTSMRENGFHYLITDKKKLKDSSEPITIYSVYLYEYCDKTNSIIVNYRSHTYVRGDNEVKITANLSEDYLSVLGEKTIPSSREHYDKLVVAMVNIQFFNPFN